MSLPSTNDRAQLLHNKDLNWWGKNPIQSETVSVSMLSSTFVLSGHVWCTLYKLSLITLFTRGHKKQEISIEANSFSWTLSWTQLKQVLALLRNPFLEPRLVSKNWRQRLAYVNVYIPGKPRNVTNLFYFFLVTLTWIIVCRACLKLLFYPNNDNWVTLG